MNADWHAKLYEVFLRAADLPVPQRTQYLDQACGDDPAFRAEVEALLMKDPGASRPRRIAHFDIRRVLGEGGMGIVYLAQRQHHPHDLVALKVIRHGMDTRDVLARFEAEQKALSLLNHPNIARLFEPGLTPEGSPYFTMEYVPGRPITEFCDSNRLNTQDRLTIFSMVCDAVDYAHKRGIIHRDIKPTNVLLCLVDGKPVPKIIDFGVAKALNFSLSERTLFTEQGRLVGTPEYMSPEQAGKAAAEIDHRSDIYSLGVLLYELLAGAPPLDGKTLREKAWDEMVRMIREFEPPKPSTRRRTLLGGETDTTAGTGIDMLPWAPREDLDQITLKAIEKLPAHRYQTAAELADIIQRYLRGEPIPWRVSSRWMRAQRHARRHRKAYARTIAAAIALAVILTVGGSITARQRENSRVQIIRQRVESLAQRASDCFQAEQWNDCIRFAEEAIDIEPQHERGLYAAAVCRYKRSEKQSEQERQLDPDLRDALRLLDRFGQPNMEDKYVWRFPTLRCAVLLEMGPPNLTEAAQANAQAIKLAPEQPYPRVYVPVACALQGQFNEALQAAKEGLQIQKAFLENSPGVRPRDIQMDELWRHLGTIQLHLRHYNDAKYAFEQAHEIDTNDHRDDVMLARYYLEKREYTQAYDLAVVTGDYKIPYYDRILAVARLRKEQYAEAIEAAKSERFGPDPCPSFRYLILAIAEAKLKHAPEARDALDRASRMWPADLEERKVIVTFNNEFLWIESYEELVALRDEAEAEINTTK